MTRATYSATPLLRSLVHRPEGVILVIVWAATYCTLHTVQSPVRVLNFAHARRTGPGYSSVLVSLERMLYRLTPLRNGTAYHSRHVPAG